MMPMIRSAQQNEHALLTDIAVRSEASWGYDIVFMENFARLYAVTPEFIRDHSVFVVEEQGRVMGFYGVVLHGEGSWAELEYLYVDPAFLGRGLGKLLWLHMTACLKALGVTYLELVTSLQAEAFYHKMGAVTIAQTASTVIPGRTIPRLHYALTEEK